MLHKRVYFIDGTQTKDNFHLLFSLPHCFASWPFFQPLSRCSSLWHHLLSPLVTTSCLVAFNVSLSLALPPLLRAVSRAWRWQLSYIWWECRQSRAAGSRLWCKRPGSQAERSPGPRRRYRAAPRCTPKGRQSHPEHGWGGRVSSWSHPISGCWTVHVLPRPSLGAVCRNTWQESLPPSRYPAHTMRSVILPT